MEAEAILSPQQENLFSDLICYGPWGQTPEHIYSQEVLSYLIIFSFVALRETAQSIVDVFLRNPTGCTDTDEDYNEQKPSQLPLVYACGDVKQFSREIWSCLSGIIQQQTGIPPHCNCNQQYINLFSNTNLSILSQFVIYPIRESFEYFLFRLFSQSGN